MVLATHAGVVVGKLEDANEVVRYAAVQTLGKLDPAVLATHAGVVVGKLEDAVGRVRSAAVETLGKLDPAVLATHAGAVVGKLEHAVGAVRRAAVETLGKLDPAVLATHTRCPKGTFPPPPSFLPRVRALAANGTSRTRPCLHAPNPVHARAAARPPSFACTHDGTLAPVARIHS